MKLDPERQETLDRIVGETEVVFGAPGMLQWIEALAETVGGYGPEKHRRWQVKIRTLLEAAAEDYGITFATVSEAHVFAGMLMAEGPGDDDEDHECSPVPAPDGESVVA